ncbi:MAG: DNA-binding protein [Chromatiales bacterium]|nr:DNA-binding protein [Chromatiales bacterium]
MLTQFHPGDDLFPTLVKTVKDQGWERAVVLSGIGSLEDVVFVAPKPAFTIPVKPAENLNKIEMKGPFELMSIEGNIVPLVGEFGAMKHGDPVLHVHCLIVPRLGGADRRAHDRRQGVHHHRDLHRQCEAFQRQEEAE